MTYFDFKFVRSFLIMTAIIICISTISATGKQPQLLLQPGNTFIDIPATTHSPDFRDATQMKIGPYLTIGNFGLGNKSWIGSNALLSYSSYDGVGSKGNANLFMPAWPYGTALVMEIVPNDGSIIGKTYKWDGQTTEENLYNFTSSWRLGRDYSFFANNVGIGTATPDEMLSVNGNIRAKEIKVEASNWPDYVFKDEYKLRPLTELENYIRTHGHLPAIPTIDEVEENGVRLGMMNTKLLEKVEELTLYIIEQNKQLEQLQHIVQDRDIEYSKLKKRLFKIESQLIGK